MSTDQVEVQLLSSELLKAVEQLNQSDLEEFVSQVIALQTQRKAASFSQAETLTSDEHKNLLRLTEQIEKLQAQRIEYLAYLAQIRGISLTALMENLGIKISEHV